MGQLRVLEKVAGRKEKAPAPIFVFDLETIVVLFSILLCLSYQQIHFYFYLFIYSSTQSTGYNQSSVHFLPLKFLYLSTLSTLHLSIHKPPALFISPPAIYQSLILSIITVLPPIEIGNDSLTYYSVHMFLYPLTKCYWQASV